MTAFLGLFDADYTFRANTGTNLVPGLWTQVTWPNPPLGEVRGITLALGPPSPLFQGAVYLDHVTVLSGSSTGAR